MISQRSVTFPDYQVRVRIEIDDSVPRPSYAGEIYARGQEPVPFDGVRLSAARGHWGDSRQDFIDAARAAVSFMSYGPTGDESDAEYDLAKEYASRLESVSPVGYDDESARRVRFRELPDIETTGETLELDDRNGRSWRAPAKVSLLEWQKRGLSETPTGYGNRLRTTRMVLYRGRWRRVYCTIWSNSGTCWIPAGADRLDIIVRD